MASCQLSTNCVVTRTRGETPPQITTGLFPPELTSNGLSSKSHSVLASAKEDMYLKQIHNEEKETASVAAVFQVTAGLAVSSGMSEAEERKKDEQLLLKRSKKLPYTRSRAGHAQGALQHVDYRSE